MNKLSKLLTISAVVFALSTSNFAMSQEMKAPTQFKVATVNLQRVVESSPSINALKTDRNNKLTDLAAFVEKARAEVTKETNAAKKKTLEDGYNKELNTRKNAIDTEYATKLAVIDKDITALIKAKSKAGCYDLVLTENFVLDGGDDITDQIIKGLK